MDEIVEETPLYLTGLDNDKYFALLQYPTRTFYQEQKQFVCKLQNDKIVEISTIVQNSNAQNIDQGSQYADIQQIQYTGQLQENENKFFVLKGNSLILIKQIYTMNNGQQEEQEIQEHSQQSSLQEQKFQAIENKQQLKFYQTLTNYKQQESSQYYNNIINPTKILRTQQNWQQEITKQLQVKCLSIEMLKQTFEKTYQEITDIVKGKVFIFNGYMFSKSKYLLEDDIEQAVRDSLLMIAAGCMNENLEIGEFQGGQINRIKYQQNTFVSPHLFYRMCQEQDLFTVNPLDDIAIFNFNNDLDDEQEEEKQFLQGYRKNECVEIVKKLQVLKDRYNEEKQFEKFHIDLIE